jgi:hypothetical protein
VRRPDRNSAYSLPHSADDGQEDGAAAGAEDATRIDTVAVLRIDDAHPQHGAKCATTMPGSALNMMDHLSVKPSRDGQCLNRLGSPCASSCL